MAAQGEPRDLQSEISSMKTNAKRKPPARAAARAAVPERKSPLEVMLLAMEAHVAAGELDKAADRAKDAAPYFHPRLSTVQATGKGGEAPGAGDAVTNRQLAMAILALLRSAAESDSGAARPGDGAAQD